MPISKLCSISLSLPLPRLFRCLLIRKLLWLRTVFLLTLLFRRLYGCPLLFESGQPDISNSIYLNGDPRITPWGVQLYGRVSLPFVLICIGCSARAIVLAKFSSNLKWTKSISLSLGMDSCGRLGSRAVAHCNLLALSTWPSIPFLHLSSS